MNWTVKGAVVIKPIGDPVDTPYHLHVHTLVVASAMQAVERSKRHHPMTKSIPNPTNVVRSGVHGRPRRMYAPVALHPTRRVAPHPSNSRGGGP